MMAEHKLHGIAAGYASEAMRTSLSIVTCLTRTVRNDGPLNA